jgi:hypothetical protein
MCTSVLPVIPRYSSTCCLVPGDSIFANADQMGVA